MAFLRWMLDATKVAALSIDNALLKMTFTGPHHVTVSSDRIGARAAAALVIFHLKPHRTV